MKLVGQEFLCFMMLAFLTRQGFQVSIEMRSKIQVFGYAYLAHSTLLFQGGITTALYCKLGIPPRPVSFTSRHFDTVINCRC